MIDETAPSPSRAASGDVLWLRLLGALTALLVISGVGLLFAYRPGPDALRSLIDLRETGRLASWRDVHHWASHGLLIVAFLALTRAFVLGEDRDRRRWLTGVGGFVVIVGSAASGWLLPGRVPDSLLAYVAHVVIAPLVVLASAVWWWRRPREETTP
ncbi:MAG: hypothetical protein AAGE94_08125 [Acidobacteriota bacterium]